MRTVAIASVTMLVLIFLGGCERADVVGSERATVGDLERTRKAVRLVLMDEGAMIAEDRRQGDVQVIEARYADGTEITVDVEALSATTSHVTVQIGHFGNARENDRVALAIQRQVRELKDAELRKARRVE